MAQLVNVLGQIKANAVTVASYLGVQRPRTYIIACADATAKEKISADATLAGTITAGYADEVTINAYLALVKGTGGTVQLVGKTYEVANPIVQREDCTFDCNGATAHVTTDFGTALVSAFILQRGRGTNGGCTQSTGAGNLVLTMNDINGFLVGDKIYVVAASGTLDGGLVAGTPYWVASIDRHTKLITLSSSSSLSPIVQHGASGSGTIYLAYARISYDHNTNLLTVNGSSPPTFADGDGVMLRGLTGNITPNHVGVPSAPTPVYLETTGTANVYTPYLDPRRTIACDATNDGTDVVLYPMCANIITRNFRVAADAGVVATTPFIDSRDVAYSLCEFGTITNGDKVFLRGFKNTYRGLRFVNAHSTQTAISINLSDGAILQDISIEGSAGAGLFSQSGNTNNNIQINGMDIRYCAKSGISISGSSNFQASGLTLFKNCVTTSAADIIVAGCSGVMIRAAVTAGPSSTGPLSNSSSDVNIHLSGTTTADGTNTFSGATVLNGPVSGTGTLNLTGPATGASGPAETTIVSAASVGLTGTITKNKVRWVRIGPLVAINIFFLTDTNQNAGTSYTIPFTAFTVAPPTPAQWASQIASDHIAGAMFNVLSTGAIGTTYRTGILELDGSANPQFRTVTASIAANGFDVTAIYFASLPG